MSRLEACEIPVPALDCALEGAGAHFSAFSAPPRAVAGIPLRFRPAEELPSARGPPQSMPPRRPMNAQGDIRRDVSYAYARPSPFAQPLPAGSRCSSGGRAASPSSPAQHLHAPTRDEFFGAARRVKHPHHVPAGADHLCKRRRAQPAPRAPARGIPPPPRETHAARWKTREERARIAQWIVTSDVWDSIMGSYELHSQGKPPNDDAIEWARQTVRTLAVHAAYKYL